RPPGPPGSAAEDCAGHVWRRFAPEGLSPVPADLLAGLLQGTEKESALWADSTSPRRAPEQFDELAGFAPLLVHVAAHDRPLDAVVKVGLQHLAFNPGQGRANRLDLGQHVDAVAV